MIISRIISVIDGEAALRLDELPFHEPARIAAIDWASLRPREGQRLRELGFDEGVAVEALHRGPVGRDPIACRIGRMTVAIRRAHAAVITVARVQAGAA